MKDYTMSTLEEFFSEPEVITIDEYFNILDKENIKRTAIVSKTLKAYLKNVKSDSKISNKLLA